MRFLARSLTGLFLAALTLGLLALAVWLVAGAVTERLSSDRPAPPARERIFTANVIPVVSGRVVPRTVTYGEILSRRTLELRAPRAGRVLEIAQGVEDGAAVREGQLLVRLDPADAQAALALAQAGLSEAEAEVRDASRGLTLARDDLAAAEAQSVLRQQALTRQDDLSARGVGSAAAVEAAAFALSAADQSVLSRRSALAQAEARVDQAASTLARATIAADEAARALADTEIRASFSGRLNGVTVVAGGLVGANERLADLIDPDRLEVAFRLSTAQFARILGPEGNVLNAPVSVSLDGVGGKIAATGRVERVGAAVGIGATGRLIFASLDRPQALRPGDFVTVTLAEPALDDVALLPASAVDSTGGVLVLGPEDRLEVREVPLLRLQGNDVIIDSRGLVGREVVVERSPFLGAGIRINPVRPAAAVGDQTGADQTGADQTGVDQKGADQTITLTPARRADLIARVQSSTALPEADKARMIDQLSQDRVPAQVVARLESRLEPRSGG
jgi:multidrug resistance efflux pump